MYYESIDAVAESMFEHLVEKYNLRRKIVKHASFEFEGKTYTFEQLKKMKRVQLVPLTYRYCVSVYPPKTMSLRIETIRHHWNKEAMYFEFYKHVNAEEYRYYDDVSAAERHVWSDAAIWNRLKERFAALRAEVREQAYEII